MEAKNTVIQLTEIRTAYPANDVSRAQMIADQKKMKEQAEISFRAGMEEEARGGHNSISYLEGHNRGWNDAFKSGIKEDK